MLDDAAQSNLSKLLMKKPAKRRAVSASEKSSLVQDTILEISAQEDVAQEAAVGTNTTMSGAATALSTASGKGALSNAALREDH